MLALPFSGCLEGVEDLVDEPAPPEAPTALPPLLPATIKDSKVVDLGTDPWNFVTGAPCSMSNSACYKYPFEVKKNETANETAKFAIQVSAELTWGTPTNDFDLYLFKGTQEVAIAGDPPPETQESFTAKITELGKYQVIVVAWAVAKDSYNLNVQFNFETPPAEIVEK